MTSIWGDRWPNRTQVIHHLTQSEAPADDFFAGLLLNARHWMLIIAAALQLIAFYMIEDRDALVDRLRRRLVAEASTAGWGYYAGKTSRIEPTCWALLALGSAWTVTAASWAEFVAPHLEYLSALQRKDGLLVETEPSLVNANANALAFIVMTKFAVPRETLEPLLKGVIASKGVRVDLNDGKQDSRIQGWSWIPETFSWVEPTSWSLLALKKADARLRTRDAAARELEAEKLLVNRVCTSGGWNYGNSSALGQDLRAYVPTTAVGLLALQNRRAVSAVQRSMQFLTEERLSERSTMALALTAICLRVYGLPVDDVEEQLAIAVLQSEKSANLQGMAMATYALSANQHNLEALRVTA
jgi:hypothetical protein